MRSSPRGLVPAMVLLLVVVAAVSFLIFKGSSATHAARRRGPGHGAHGP